MGRPSPRAMRATSQAAPIAEQRRGLHAWFPRHLLVILAVGMTACSSLLPTGSRHQNGPIVYGEAPATVTTPTPAGSSLGRLAFVRGGDIVRSTDEGDWFGPGENVRYCPEAARRCCSSRTSSSSCRHLGH